MCGQIALTPGSRDFGGGVKQQQRSKAKQSKARFKVSSGTASAFAGSRLWFCVWGIEFPTVRERASDSLTGATKVWSFLLRRACSLSRTLGLFSASVGQCTHAVTSWCVRVQGLVLAIRLDNNLSRSDQTRPDQLSNGLPGITPDGSSWW